MKSEAKLLMFFMLLSISLNAQDEQQKHWKMAGKVGFNFSQSHLSNWAAGGQSALNSLALFRYEANYSNGPVKFDNNIDMNLGYSLIGK